VSQDTPKAFIVGSGIAGIASAIRLATKGYSVEIFEKNSYAGGKLTVLEMDGFRFDAGPSLFTMPHFVEELFELAGKNTADYFRYAKHETACHYFFEDGTFLKFQTDTEALAKEINDKLDVPAKPFLNYLKHSEFIYKKTSKTFLEMSLHKWKNFMSVEVLKSMLAIPKLGLFTSMHKKNEKSLNHPKLVQIADRYATYNGSNPYLAPAILNVIPHFEHGFGTFFPEKGMHSIPQSLLKLANDLGVVVHLNSPVEEIKIGKHAVSGVKVLGETLHADIVVCNSDIRPAYKYLLKDATIPMNVKVQEPSSSAMIFYWGMDRTFESLDLHNIFFSENYQEEFNEMFLEKGVSDDPTAYIHVSSKVKPDDAPIGMENWFVMVNVPSNAGQDWEGLRLKIRQSVIAKLSRILGVEIESHIVQEDYLDPIRIEERTSSYAGALYGASSNDRMAAFLRHPNFSDIDGLYFVGGSVHPGGGIPLCLLSAKIVADML
jgi:phytoene desaturase